MDKNIVGNNVPYFHEGIISEILSYLEVKSLLRFKSVCKLWYAAIKEKGFVEIHMRRNEGRFHYFICEHLSDNSVGFLDTVQYISSINGLLLEKIISPSTSPSGTSTTKYRISNPSTKETFDIPNPNKISLIMIIYFNSSTGLYYLFSVSTKNIERRILVEVLNLGCLSTDPCNCEDLSWRFLNIAEINKVTRYDGYVFVIGLSDTGMLIVFRTPNGGVVQPEIICVDLVLETGTTCMAPKCILYDMDRVKFQLWHGKPAILSLVKSELSVWVLEDYKEQKWSDKMVISLPRPGDPTLSCGPIIFFDSNGEDAIICRYPSADFVYKLKSKVMSTATPDTTRALRTVKVAETLVSLKGMRRSTKIEKGT